MALVCQTILEVLENTEDDNSGLCSNQARTPFITTFRWRELGHPNFQDIQITVHELKGSGTPLLRPIGCTLRRFLSPIDADWAGRKSLPHAKTPNSPLVNSSLQQLPSVSQSLRHAFCALPRAHACETRAFHLCTQSPRRNRGARCAKLLEASAV